MNIADDDMRDQHCLAPREQIPGKDVPIERIRQALEMALKAYERCYDANLYSLRPLQSEEERAKADSQIGEIKAHIETTKLALQAPSEVGSSKGNAVRPVKSLLHEINRDLRMAIPTPGLPK